MVTLIAVRSYSGHYSGATVVPRGTQKIVTTQMRANLDLLFLFLYGAAATLDHDLRRQTAHWQQSHTNEINSGTTRVQLL